MANGDSTLESETLAYHEFPRPGKLEVRASKGLNTQHDLSLAYTPGVAIPCLKIEDDPDAAYRYTNRGNLVAVITNGTAVLGLGDIGALAGKPVMEGKAVLFKKFAGVDVFDIEVDAHDVDALVETVRRIAPTFGGINLEDIKSPECFEVEQRLKEALDIPVFHDDQHGTAIISAAALINACDLAGKEFSDLKVVCSGAGAAGIACIDMFVKLGVDRSKVIFADSKGVIYTGRTERMNAAKEAIAADTPHRTLAEAMVGSDLFLGVSGPDLVTQDMVRSMADRPIVFAMANPDPEISYPDAVAARSDVIMATGRSDYPNQINNVLCFPFIFRGALDVRATTISDGMKLACARALAELARETVPDSVREAYGGTPLHFGATYLIPKPFDHRVLLWVAPAVAQAAVEDGSARTKHFDLAKYRRSLNRYLGAARTVMSAVEDRARRAESARIAFAEGEEPRSLRAAQTIRARGIGEPVLVGSRDQIRFTAEAEGIDITGMQVVDPRIDPRRKELANAFFELRSRRGVNPHDASVMMMSPIRYALMLERLGYVDCTVAGVNRSYPKCVTAAMQIIGTTGGRDAAALHLMVTKDRNLFFADTSVHINPSAEELAEIAIAAADAARAFDEEPRIAVLSFSNFGSVDHAAGRNAEQAVKLVRQMRPDLRIDGEMHADVALDPEYAESAYPHSLIQGDANVLVFPNLSSGNIGYKLLEHLSAAEAIGPILLNMNQPVVVGYQAVNVQTLVNLISIAIAGPLDSAKENLAAG